MTTDTALQDPLDLAHTIAVVDANAQLLRAQMHQTQLKSAQLEAALALVVGIVARDPELEDGPVAQRIAGLLRLCADLPDLAAEMVGCDPDRIDPALLRAAAGVVSPRDLARPEAWPHPVPCTRH